jgi:hypothetical protein
MNYNQNNLEGKLSQDDINNLISRRNMELNGSAVTQQNVNTNININSNNANIAIAQVLLNNPIIKQNETLIAPITRKILEMPSLVELMNKDVERFKMQILDNNFLRMIINNIQNELVKNTNPDKSNEPSIYQPIINQPPINTNQHQNQNQALINSNPLSPTGEAQKTNILPPLTDVHYIEYNLSLNNLDFNDNKYVFTKYGNISKVKLNSITIELINSESDIQNELYVTFTELGGKTYLSNNDNVFGKLLLHSKGSNFMTYIPEYGTCYNIFLNPIYLETLTMKLYNIKLEEYDPSEIPMSKMSKLNNKNNKNLKLLKLTSINKHNLLEKSQLIVHFIKDDLLIISNSDIYKIEDEYTFIISYSNEIEDDFTGIKIIKNNYKIMLNLSLYEINYPIILGIDKMYDNIKKLNELLIY